MRLNCFVRNEQRQTYCIVRFVFLLYFSLQLFLTTVLKSTNYSNFRPEWHIGPVIVDKILRTHLGRWQLAKTFLADYKKKEIPESSRHKCLSIA